MRSVPPVVFVSLLGLAACAPAGSSAYVSANVPLNTDCTINETQAISAGLWDALPRGTDKQSCIRPYRMSLVINSNLIANTNPAIGRVEPNALLVKYADVRLMDKSEATIGFRARNNTVPPNPYRVYTSAIIKPSMGDEPSTGWVEVDAIPSLYADQIGEAYEGDSILVELQLAGETTGNVEVDFPPFLYPLAICRDCKSVCLSDPQFAGDPAALTELNEGRCNDNRAQDDRTCVDSGC